MNYAVGVTGMLVGGVLVYAGFTDTNIWDTVLNILRGQPAKNTPTTTTVPSAPNLKLS